MKKTLILASALAVLNFAAPVAAQEKPATDVLSKMFIWWNEAFRTPGAYTPEKAEELIEKGLIDAVAFGRDFIANPDLVARLQRKAALNPQRPESFYGGGAEGYTDYPSL